MIRKERTMRSVRVFLALGLAGAACGGATSTPDDTGDDVPADEWDRRLTERVVARSAFERDRESLGLAVDRELDGAQGVATGWIDALQYFECEGTGAGSFGAVEIARHVFERCLGDQGHEPRGRRTLNEPITNPGFCIEDEVRERFVAQVRDGLARVGDSCV